MLTKRILKWSRCVIDYRRFLTVENSKDLLFIPVTHIKRILDVRDIEYTEGHTNIIIDGCPIKCLDRDRNKNSYVNKMTGVFVCHSCDRTGPWSWLEPKLMETPEINVYAKYSCTISQQEFTKDFTLICKEKTIFIRHVLNDLNLKYLTIETLSKLEAYINYEESSLLLPLKGAGGDNINGWIKLSRDAEGKTREQILGSANKRDVNKLPSLLASEIAWNSNEVVLVPSVCDFLALTSESIPAMFLAAGPKHLPLEVLPVLEQFSKIILWYSEYTSSARTFSHKLGEYRCFLVSDQIGSPHDLLLMNQKLESILNEAQPALHPAIINFKAIRMDVRSELERGDISLGTQWKRFPKLNNILGGFRPGEVTILSGPTGSGKTTFLSEYSLDLCTQGINTLWGSFEIRNTRLAKTMISQLAGYRIEKSMERFDEVADILESLPLHFLTFHGQEPVQKVMEVVNHASYVYDLGHIIIDNVQFMLGLGQDNKFNSRFILQDRVIEAFRNHATKYNCHITLVIHPRKEDQTNTLTINSIYGSAKATQEADNVLIIQNQSTPISKKYIQVVKNRYTGTLGSMLLNFNKESLCYETKNNTVPKLYDFLHGNVITLKRVAIGMNE